MSQDNKGGTSHRFLVRIFVMACRMVMPAFSTSFFDSPIIRHTFRAGWGVYTSVLAPDGPAGRVFTCVMSTFCERTFKTSVLVRS